MTDGLNWPSASWLRPWLLLAAMGGSVAELEAAPPWADDVVPSLVDEAEAVFAPFSPMRRWMGARPAKPEAVAPTPSRLLTEPIEAMRYVGFLDGAHGRMALLAVAGEVHVVRVGQRVGLEGARVARVQADALAFEWRAPGGQAPAAMPHLPFAGEPR
jgi:hypothetical protein